MENTVIVLKSGGKIYLSMKIDADNVEDVAFECFYHLEENLDSDTGLTIIEDVYGQAHLFRISDVIEIVGLPDSYEYYRDDLPRR